MRFLFSSSKILQKWLVVSYKVFLINHIGCIVCPSFPPDPTLVSKSSQLHHNCRALAPSLLPYLFLPATTRRSRVRWWRATARARTPRGTPTWRSRTTAGSEEEEGPHFLHVHETSDRHEGNNYKRAIICDRIKNLLSSPSYSMSNFRWGKLFFRFSILRQFLALLAQPPNSTGHTIRSAIANWVCEIKGQDAPMWQICEQRWSTSQFSSKSCHERALTNHKYLTNFAEVHNTPSGQNSIEFKMAWK